MFSARCHSATICFNGIRPTCGPSEECSGVLHIHQQRMFEMDDCGETLSVLILAFPVTGGRRRAWLIHADSSSATR